MSIENYHTFVDGNRRADVILNSDGNVWGIDMYENSQFIKREFYEGHSEAYAESAAENFVSGVKN